MILARILLALVLLGAEAQAGDADPTTRHHLTLHGKQIPLPAGDWLVAGSASSVTDVAGRVLPGPVATLVLFRLEGGSVTAFITVHTNILPAQHGWGVAAACGRTDLYAVTQETGVDGEVSCSFVAPVEVAAAPSGASSSPAWQRARALAGERGWRLPERWLMAGARQGDREDFVDIRYHFAPQQWGWPDSGADSMPSDLVRSLVRWRPAMAAAVESGLKNRLADDFTLSCPDADPDDVAAGPDGRTRVLDALLAEGLLSPIQYQEQLRPAPEPGSDSSDDAPAALGLLAVKTVGWRVVVALSVALLSYAFTSSAAVAGGITIATAVVNGGLYFGHELLWRDFDRAPAAPAQTIEFAGAGTTR